MGRTLSFKRLLLPGGGAMSTIAPQRPLGLSARHRRSGVLCSRNGSGCGGLEITNTRPSCFK